ncbi:MAG: citryl-CoA lyase [Gammaproteobacteria bacterium]|jgi:citrate synthase
MTDSVEKFRTRIWEEVSEPDNPFAAAACYCHGYDVYGDILGKASWIEYLYLLFRSERPSPQQTRLLEGLALALANPGVRDPSVHAAMSGGAGGSTNASCLMAALAVGAGQLGGAHEVYRAMEYWRQCGRDLAAWQQRLLDPPQEEHIDIWPAMEHPPGFDPHGVSCATPVRQTLLYLAKCSPGEHLPWLEEQRDALERAAELPLGMSGVTAATFMDLDFAPQAAEMTHLLLRLPGAAVHALEQREYGWRRFPFFANAINLTNDPGPATVDTHQKELEI